MPLEIRRGRRAAIAALVAPVAGALALAAMSASAADFTDKTITVAVGNHPGGGYDAYTRTLARFLPKYLPGHPNAIVKNMPGAAGLVLANYSYNTAPKDGTFLGIFASSVAFSPLFETKGAKFDIRKFTWIGNLDQTVGTCTTWHTSGLRSFQDLFQGVPIFGATGANGVNSEHPRGFNALFGTHIKVIHGYPGSTGVTLAMKRGEIQGGCGFALSSLKSVRRADWQAGRLIVLVQTGYEKSDELKDVPHIYDYAKTDEDRKVLDLIYGRHILGRPVSAPPGLDADVTKTLRTAFMQVVKDKEFLAAAEKQHLPVNPWSGEKVEAIVNKFMSYPDSVVKRARLAMKKGKVIKVKLKKLEARITGVGKKGVKVADADGKEYSLKVSGRRSKVTIAGEKAKGKALKVGMSCSFDYFGDGDLAKTVRCP